MSSTSGTSSQLAGVLVQAIRGAVAESTPPSSVQSLQALSALDLGSVVIDEPDFHSDEMRVQMGQVLVSALSRSLGAAGSPIWW